MSYSWVEKLKEAGGLFGLFGLLAALLYSPAISGGWYFDDLNTIALNEQIRSVINALQNSVQLRGIPLLSFSLDYFFWGLDPSWSRSVNIVLHLLNSMLVYYLCKTLLRKHRKLWALLAALIFLCHPVQTAAVSYIVQRMVLLGSLFALSSLLLICRYFHCRSNGNERRAWIYLALAVVCGLLSVGSKESSVLLVMIIPVFAGQYGLDIRSRISWQALLPFLLLPVCGLLLLYQTNLTSLHNIDTTPMWEAAAGKFYAPLTDHDWLPLRYLLSQGEVFWVYLTLVCVPAWQVFDRCWPLPPLELRFLPLFTGVVLIAGSVLVFKLRRKFPLSFLGFCWVLCFMAVESSIPLDPIFEHRLYLPLVGFILIICEQLSVRLSSRQAVLFSISIILCLATLSWQRNRLWGNPVDFWQANHLAAPRAPRPYLNFAIENFRRRRFVAAAKAYTELYQGTGNLSYLTMKGSAEFFAGNHNVAFNDLAKVAETDPSENSLQLFRALLAVQQKRWTEAENWLGQAEKIFDRDPRIPFVRGELAIARTQPQLAAIYFQKALNRGYGISSREIASYELYLSWATERRQELLDRLAVDLQQEKEKLLATPEDINSKGRFANRLLELGLFEDAIVQYLEIREQKPELWFLHYNLGLAYEKISRFDLATDSYLEAMRLNPGNTDILMNLGWLYLDRHRLDNAVDCFNELLKQAPAEGRAWIGKGLALERKQAWRKARQAYQAALKLPGTARPAARALQKLAELEKRSR